LQQVGIKGFADAQLVDPRQLPAPLQQLSRRTRINLGHAWVLHRRLFLRGIAAGIVLIGVVGAYEARESIVAGTAMVAGTGTSGHPSATWRRSRPGARR